ncbi:hypothetical protein SYNTR_1483 [Candidatus Syntrophocurvum alkaliphilum]|uniref:Uncharacterized protein n=1 Tax=Candidatus Syntrophocurvum alkaliphilum TaxID=2293317 RepID=A0A6I6DG38_9FIRM|nr:hypothetical protein [Candidatus Syntrophocurvum alkaliphilum]QGU00077.1 hypothetical protein SYNTR_1483 [Candidatus Syntrophocurvum alkaliphilum]
MNNHFNDEDPKRLVSVQDVISNSSNNKELLYDPNNQVLDEKNIDEYIDSWLFRI